MVDNKRRRSETTRTKPIVLTFFCGDHIDQKRDINASPAGILNNLLAQLLQQEQGFSISSTAKFKELDAEDVRDLCKAFYRLIKQLSEGLTVICLIDGISFYDDAPRRRDLAELVEFLATLSTAGGKHEFVFKTLLTVPGRTAPRFAYQLLEQQEILRIPDKVEPAGMNGLAACQNALNSLRNTFS